MDVGAAIIALSLVLLAAVGVLLAATPWLMPSRECFAVTVPAEAEKDPVIRRIKRRYTVAVAGATVVFALVEAVLAAAGLLETLAAVAVVGALVLTLLSFGLMLWARSKVQAIKRERGWQAVSGRRSAVVVEGDLPHAVSLWWQLLNVPIIVGTLLIGLAGYGSMPDMVPMHVGFNGEVTSWAEKSLKVVFFTPALQLFMTACLAFSQWTILRSKKAVSPDMPVASAYAYGLFARAQSVLIVVMGVLLNLSFIAMQLSMIGVMSIMAAGCVVMVVALLAVIGAVGIAVVYGQSGSRLMARTKDEDVLPSDDDRFWKLGLFYVNPGDPSLFVPARFGIGWTNNFGRPLTWVILGVVAAVILGFIVACVMLL